MKVLITGAAGFIGSHAVRSLQAQHDVYAMVRKQPSLNQSSIQWIEHDLTRPLDYKHLPQRVDAVIHLAQSRYYRQFPERADDVFAVNIAGTFQLLEYARKVGAEIFVFASSGGVYGNSYEKFVETDQVNPINFYLSSKYTAELLIANYQQFFRTVVFRFFFVYGPGQKGMLIPTLLSRVANGEPITIEGRPGLRINPVYVADVVSAFGRALRLQTSELFNLAGDEAVTITDLVRLMETIVGKQAIVHHVERTPNGDLVADNSRMKEVLGVYPHTSLNQGLRSMLEANHGR